VLSLIALAGCRPMGTPVPPATRPRPEASRSAIRLQTTGDASNVAVTGEPAPLPHAQGGPYHAGKRTFVVEDATRDNRQVSITVWYPALRPEGSSGTVFQVGADREPDQSGAPYPLILSSTKAARVLAPYLITHGFTWASVDYIDTYGRWNEQMIEQPLDILFALDQVAAKPPAGLEGMVDADHTGVIGYSFDGYNALAMSGARIDPQFYLSACADGDTGGGPMSSPSRSYHCALADAWDEFAAHAGESITAGEDGLWRPMTDERIRAAMPLAGEGWWLFGERGLAAVDRPTLMVVGTKDALYEENVLILDHLGTDDKALILFVEGTHFMVYEDERVACMAHFAVAFFGTHLQGRQDLAHYFSEDFVAQHPGLAWGAYEDK
jgi:predicted dienelactone hydrolase